MDHIDTLLDGCLNPSDSERMKDLKNEIRELTIIEYTLMIERDSCRLKEQKLTVDEHRKTLENLQKQQEALEQSISTDLPPTVRADF